MIELFKNIHLKIANHALAEYSFAMTLDDYLKSHSISGPVFAELIGVDPATVYRIRKRQVLPHRRTIVAIIQATEGLVRLGDFISVETPQQTGEPAE